MVKNIWKKTSFYCNNPLHEEPVPMVFKEGAISSFYACPKYMKKDSQHPDGHEEDERACANRLSFDAAQNIMMAISDKISEAYFKGIVIDLTGQTFRVRYASMIYEVSVLLHRQDKIKIGIVNTSAVKKGR